MLLLLFINYCLSSIPSLASPILPLPSQAIGRPAGLLEGLEMGKGQDGAHAVGCDDLGPLHSSIASSPRSAASINALLSKLSSSLCSLAEAPPSTPDAGSAPLDREFSGEFATPHSGCSPALRESSYYRKEILERCRKRGRPPIALWWLLQSLQSYPQRVP